MIDALELAWILGSFFGVLYPAVVAVVCLIAAGLNRAFRPRAVEWLSLLAPAALYYYLEYLVVSRQGWKLPEAVLALSGFGALVVIVACALGKPRALLLGSAAGMLLAVVLWRLIPYEGWSRLM